MYTAPINPAVMMGTTATAPNKQAAASGDFAAMLMQMFGGQATEGTGMDGLLGTDSTMQYAQQLLAQQGDTAEQDEQDGTDNAMQMLSALFAATPADVSYVQSPMAYQGGTQGVTAMSQQAYIQQQLTAQAPSAQQASFTLNGEALTPEQLAALAQTVPPEQLAQLVKGTAPAQQPATTDMAQQATAATTKPVEQRTGTTVQRLWTQVVDTTEAGATKPANATRELDPLMNAYNRLYGIHKPVDAGTKIAEVGIKPAKTVDIEAMQQAVDNGTYLNPSVATVRDLAAATEQVSPRDIASQVQSGIIANLDSEQKEFVIKLRPEGLGNITVKMVENAGKISLSIITSTQQAQNALSSEISSLREALRPFNAEITQLVANDMSFAQQQGMNEQRREGYQGEQHRNNRFWEPEDTTTPEELHEYAQHVSSSSNLNARV